MYWDQGTGMEAGLGCTRTRDGSSFGMCQDQGAGMAAGLGCATALLDGRAPKKKSEPEKQKGHSPTIPALLGELYLAIRASSITNVQRLSWGSAALGSAARSEQLSHLIVIPAAD